MERFTSIENFNKRQKKLEAALDPNEVLITLCGGTGCTAFASGDVQRAFDNELRKRGLADQVRLKRTGCQGFCEKGPIVVILPKKIFYPSVQATDVAEIIDTTVIKGGLVERLLYVDSASGEKVSLEPQVPFYGKQQRAVFHLNGILDPIDIEDYIAREGYSAAAKALGQMSPDEVIEEVLESGLRGRGGAGFPTGRKWQFARAAKGEPKYIICNADEGDPGAFMDRSLLEGTPHAIIEGILIAGYAIGASHGVIYVRAEYPLAVQNTNIALAQARECGLLGEDVLGSGFDFDIAIHKGAGAFVCGEETALIASVEGRRGMPRPRPPFPVASGLYGKPTNINNVETLANVPLIVLKGKDAYRATGTEASKGTKIFALAGKVNNTGLVEVQMGATLR